MLYNGSKRWNMKHIDKRLQELREANKLSQAELAKRLGISRTAVSAWELGVSKPHIEHLAELSRIFNVTADYILDMKRDTIDVTDLNDTERRIVVDLVNSLRTYKKTNK
jgi:transcriptional regulator with XRE-family HTH domain